MPQEEQKVVLTAFVLHMQDPSKPVFDSDSDLVPLLLTFVANRSNQEVAMVWGAQKVYKDRKRPKGCADNPPGLAHAPTPLPAKR